MKLTEALSYLLITMALGMVGVFVNLFFPSASVYVLSSFCMVMAFAVAFLGAVHLLSGTAPMNFTGKKVFRAMQLPLLYVLVGIIFVEAVRGSWGMDLWMNVLDWVGIFFVLAMSFCLTCRGNCNK